MYDYIIIGAGFAGTVMANKLANDGNKILIVDKRDHIAGNAYDYVHDGVLIHKYGPHIFHTNSDEIFEYLSQFTKWRQYEHRVLSMVKSKAVPIPINRTTINKLFNLNLQPNDVQPWIDNEREDIPVKNSEDAVVALVGRQLYELMFKGYTKKQWGIGAEELQPSVCARIPFRTGDDDRYFTDKHQAMPADGYTAMFEKMLGHENIEVMLNVSHTDIEPLMLDAKIIYTGAIDEYFNFLLGSLPYRSLRFEHCTIPSKNTILEVGQVNYPEEFPAYTRMVEHRHLTGQKCENTVVTFEFPVADGLPYYPIPTDENRALYEQYAALAKGLNNHYFIGRLASYRYYNMDMVIAQALTLHKKITAKNIG